MPPVGVAVCSPLPFGGYKASGIGRELGEVGLQPCLESKTMVFEG